MASFNGFRLVCDLSEFFSDVRRKLLIYVDPSKDRCIADLLLRVKTMTGLCQFSNIVLSIDDCLLSTTEDIRILHQQDVLKFTKMDHVVPVLESDHENNPDLCEKKHKDKSKKKKRKKKKISESESLQIEENLVEDVREIDEKRSLIDSGTTKEVVDAIFPVASVNDSDCRSGRPTAPEDSNLGETGPRVQKRKRTRVRVRHRRSGKYKMDSTCTNDGDFEMSSVDGSRPVFSYCPSKLKHIRFSDDHENKKDEKSCEAREPSGTLPDGLDSMPIDIPQNETCARTPFRHKDQLQPKTTQWDIMHSTSRNNQEIVENGNKSEGKYVNNHNQSFSKLLALAYSTPLVVKHSRPPVAEVKSIPVVKTPLQGLPKDGDILTFKILRLDENYCPQVSNDITAKVLHYANATNEVSVEILDGWDQCRQPKGKFAIETDGDENIEEEQSSVIQLNWNEIIEPCCHTF